MDLLENYYGKQTFILYSLFAKVPGSRTWPRKIFVIYSIIILSWVVMFQSTKLVIEKFQREAIIEFLPTIAAGIGTLLYVPYVAYTTEKEYMALLSIMVDDLRGERTEEEEAIKRKYAKSAEMYINAYTIIFSITMCGIPLAGLIPNFLDLILPLNKTRERHHIFIADIFSDEERCFYLIYFLECSAVFITGIVIAVSENMSLIIGLHACGMTAVLGHRLKNLTQIEEHQVLNKADFMHLVSRRLGACIKAHQNILHFSVLIAAFYNIPLTLILIGTFTALIASLVQVTDPELINTTIALFTLGQIFQLFILSIMGQTGLDASERIIFYAYDADWCICSPHLRRLLQLISLRASRPCAVVAANMYMLSVENFMSVMQTVTSFYMVLRRT